MVPGPEWSRVGDDALLVDGEGGVAAGDGVLAHVAEGRGAVVVRGLDLEELSITTYLYSIYSVLVTKLFLIKN